MKSTGHARLSLRLNRAGFTLIEMLIVVAVIGILAAIAYPSYTNYIIRANRSAAQQFMLHIASRQEQYRLDARSYASTLAMLNLTQPAETVGRYTFAISNTVAPPTATDFTITATATGAQASDGNLTLDNLGAKAPADKWKK